MAYTLESINGCTKKISFNFETLDLAEQVKRSVKEKQQKASFKGFRKGKAPLEMVKKVYGAEIETDALNQYIQDEFFDTVAKESLRVVGHPMFENMKYVSGKSVSFDAVVEIFPEFDLKDMSNLTFEKDRTDVEDEDIEKVKKSYLESKANIVEVEDGLVELTKGHIAIMNFEGVKADGERPENMKGKDFQLEIGSGKFIPGFEEGMIGMKKGEKKNINLEFPHDYHAADLGGANVVFEVELLEIKEKKLPEFSDELAKEFKYDSMEDFYTKTKKNLIYQKERQSKEKLHQDILKKLVDENTFDIPETLKKRQFDYIQEDMSKNLKQQGFNDNMLEEYFEKWKDEMNEKAIFQVKSGLILDKLGREFEVESSESDFEAKISEAAEHSGMDTEHIRKYYSEPSVKNNMMYAIREEKTFEKIIEKVKIS